MRLMWTHEKTPTEYEDFFSSEMPSGVGDEVSLSIFLISTWPEEKDDSRSWDRIRKRLAWIDKLGNLSGIVGIDYSKPMLSFCGKQKRTLKHELILVEDDLLRLESNHKDCAAVR